MLHPDLRRYRLPVPASRLLHMEESLGEVQIALPQFPSQKAGAYLLAVRTEAGAEGMVALRLIDSGRLVFYRAENPAVEKVELQKHLAEARQFAESLGFLLSAVDLARMPEEEKESFWQNCPVCRGGSSPPAELLNDHLAGARRRVKDRLGRILVGF